MKTPIKFIAGLCLVASLASCSKDYRYTDSATTDQAASSDVLVGTTWRSDKETTKSFVNSVMLNENSVNFDSSNSASNNAFDLIFTNAYMYKVMRSSGDTTQMSRYTFDGLTMVLLDYNSANNQFADDESNKRSIHIQGTVMTSIDLGIERSENNTSGGLFNSRTERITILRRVR